LRLNKAQKLGASKIPVAANTLLVPLAANAKNYISEMPDGKIAQVPFAAVKSVVRPAAGDGVASSANGSSAKTRM
jgi:hypothetical protein